MPTSDTILPFITIIILLLFLLIVLIIIWPQLFASPPMAPCPAGFCATNIFSGEKTCPIDTSGVIMYNPTLETCNIPNGCNTNSGAPCLYYDPTIGTVCPGDPLYQTLKGVCPNEVTTEQCKCLPIRFCPNFATVYFERNQIPNAGASGEFFTAYIQNDVWNDQINAPRSDLPMSPGLAVESVPSVCGISSDNLSTIWPPGQCVRGTLTWSQRDQLWYCTNLPAGLSCSGAQVPILTLSGQLVCGIFS